MMDFPQKIPYKLTAEEMANVNQAICKMDGVEEVAFNYFTKPNESEIQAEVSKLKTLLVTAFYPVPIGASAPILDIYQRALKLQYRSVRTTLALIKYYLCPTLYNDMEKFFVKYVIMNFSPPSSIFSYRCTYNVYIPKMKTCFENVTAKGISCSAAKMRLAIV